LATCEVLCACVYAGKPSAQGHNLQLSIDAHSVLWTASSLLISIEEVSIKRTRRVAQPDSEATAGHEQQAPQFRSDGGAAPGKVQAVQPASAAVTGATVGAEAADGSNSAGAVQENVAATVTADTAQRAAGSEETEEVTLLVYRKWSDQPKSCVSLEQICTQIPICTHVTCRTRWAACIAVTCWSYAQKPDEQRS